MKFELPITPPDRVTGLVGSGPSLGGGPELPVYYPATGARIASLVEDGPEAVEHAVTRAREAFDRGDWRSIPVEARVEMLEQLSMQADTAAGTCDAAFDDCVLDCQPPM